MGMGGGGLGPTCLYRKDREDVSPVFDSERQILCIDGGNGLKRSGQLNGIVIPHCQAQMEEIRWTGYDGSRQIEALERQKGRAASVHIQYFDIFGTGRWANAPPPLCAL